MDMGGSEKCPSSSYELRLFMNLGLITNHVSRLLACVFTCIDASQHGRQYPSLFSVGVWVCCAYFIVHNASTRYSKLVTLYGKKFAT